MSREAMQQALDALELEATSPPLETTAAAIAALQAALAEQPAAPAEFARICDSLPEGVNWGDPLTPAMARHIFESAIPPGHCVVKDEPVARMLTWRGPSHTPTPPRAARTYAEFPEDAALPANKEAYWENAEPLYAARPGSQR